MADAIDMNGKQGAVIWITGFSGAGKTTVSAIVHQRLQAAGEATLLLDGDKLRHIYGDRWGYSREDRIDLGYVNFRFCQHLTAQGINVILAAGGMYDEIFAWASQSLPRFTQVYLEVPDEERRARDNSTKHVYGRIGDLGTLFDGPSSPHLVIRNYGEKTPEASADAIIAHYRQTLG